MNYKQEIPPLLEKYRLAVDSIENRKKQELYLDPGKEMRPFRALSAARYQPGDYSSIPFQVYFLNSFWSDVFGFSLKEYYTNPEHYLYHWLRTGLYMASEIKDDTPLYANVPIQLTGTFEVGCLGIEMMYSEKDEPWPKQEPVMESLQDRDFLENYRFGSSGLMPLALRYYEVISQYVLPFRFEVSFPRWTRGPLGLAMQLRGTENLLMDMIDNPEEAQKLFHDLVDLHKRFYTDREKALGLPIRPLVAINNDEVNLPIISPEMYTTLVLPCESQIAQFHGGLQYFHSCGNITGMLESIRLLKPKMVMVSPVTDLERATDVFADTPLEVSLHPVRDVQMATDDQMRDAIEALVDVCARKEVKAFHITQGGLQPLRYNKIEYEVARVKSWVSIFRAFQRQ